jgi:hypothetical protein
LLLQEIVCVHSVLGLKSIKSMKLEILIKGLKITVVWYVMPYSSVDKCESFLEPLIILNMEGAGISETLVVFIKLHCVIL